MKPRRRAFRWSLLLLLLLLSLSVDSPGLKVKKLKTSWVRLPTLDKALVQQNSIETLQCVRQPLKLKETFPVIAGG